LIVQERQCLRGRRRHVAAGARLVAVGGVEGHGLREPKHIIDNIDRCIDWYLKHFTGAK